MSLQAIRDALAAHPDAGYPAVTAEALRAALDEADETARTLAFWQEVLVRQVDASLDSAFERCAAVCDGRREELQGEMTGARNVEWESLRGRSEEAHNCADAIRALRGGE